MTATTEQLLALLRDAQEFLDHTAICDVVTKFGSISPYPSCTCGMRLLMARLEDALANQPAERPTSSSKSLPRRAIKVVNTGKDDGDDDGN